MCVYVYVCVCICLFLSNNHPCKQLLLNLSYVMKWDNGWDYYSRNKINSDCLGWVCIPLTVETYGCWGEEAGRCLDRVATRIATQTGCPKSSAVSGLYGRLSIALVRANARALLARSPSFIMTIWV